MDFNIEVLIRLILSVFIGAVIGNERARHGRAAGMRTHIFVCLGACLTSVTSVFVNTVLGLNGDVFRISAQVISGIGFLGAGMIILKGNNTISGLTTAAGVWATAAIGVALGYGFYVGAAFGAVLVILALFLFSMLEKNNKNTMVLYFELNDAKKVNAVLNELNDRFSEPYKYLVFAPKSEQAAISGSI